MNGAILAETTAFSGTEAELRDFHRRIGSNLSLIEPIEEKTTATRRTLASKERGAKFTKPKASRRGGLAARDSVRHDSGHQAGARITSPAVTSEDHPTSDAESHDSASRKIKVKKSSSRWADRPIPVLQVEFPEPWSIIAHAASADAEGGEIAGNLKWSGRHDLNVRHPAPKA
ncbi:MAG: hypothetical protein H6970_15250 [Gammaproteobacteria bacterium]|nr:hypothetical protein [Gammaproteobacteria bacterium]